MIRDHRKWRGWGVQLGVALVFVSGAGTNVAHAYRTFADDPEVRFPAVLPDRVVRWDLAFGGVDTGDLVRVEAAAIGAVDAWSAPACTDIVGDFLGSRSGRAEPGDGRNTIELVGSGWGDRGFDADRGAITDVILRETETGWEIAEADIYVDFEGHRWDVEGAVAGALDLRAVLTHEWGHLLGFSHPFAGDEGATSSTMFPEYMGVGQRVLSPDDTTGLCDLYPADMLACEPECSAGYLCVSGTCVEECPGGDCRSCEDRTCDVMCVGDADCPGALVCGVGGDDRGWCVGPGALGAPCSAAEDCGSELCLTSMRNGAFCTRACRTTDECPSGHTCQSISSEDVCAPVLSSSSCAAGPGRTRGGALAIFVLVAVLVRARRSAS